MPNIKSEQIKYLLQQSKERKPIRIKSEKKDPGCVVRISPAAMEVLSELASVTGQSMSYIASEFILQGVDNAELVPSQCIGCEYEGQCELETCEKK